jgi:cell division protein FtsB
VKSLAFYKILVAALSVLLVLVGVLSVFLFLQAKRELDHFKNREGELRQQLANLQVQLESREEFLQRLQNDPDFLDRVVRQRLGYARPDELIFRFDVDQKTATLPGTKPAVEPPAPQKPAPAPPSRGAPAKAPASPPKPPVLSNATKPAPAVNSRPTTTGNTSLRSGGARRN